MSEIGEDFEFLHELHREERDARLPDRRAELLKLREEGYTVINFGAPFETAFHYRISVAGKPPLDIWPSRNKWAFHLERYLQYRVNGRNRGTIPEQQTITEFVHEMLPIGKQVRS